MARKRLGYEDASVLSQKVDRRGLTRQTFQILRKIAEVDDIMVPERQKRVFEVHPELCFMSLAGRPMRHAKKRRAGLEERRELLASLVGRGPLDRALGALTRSEAAHDDVLDAIVAAWTARCHALGRSVSLPVVPESDARGLRMEMVYPGPRANGA